MEQNDMPTTASSTSSGNTQATQSSQLESSSQGFADRARDLAGSAQDKLADVGTSVRERTGDVKDKLADALESGADKVRSATSSNGSATQLATANGATSAIAEDGRLSQAGGKVAGGMEATADWLRELDIDGLKSGLENQVKNHPGRTLLIAAGVGYLLGKALKK